MEQFIVPQFIDVEDKILGPITTRQFVLMLVGTLLAFLCYKLFAFWTFVGLGALDIGLVSVFAFAKINGRPIHFFLLNFLQTKKRASLRVWNRESYVYAVKIVSELKEEKKISLAITPREPITGSRLSDLTLVINTGGVYGGEEFK